MVTNTTGGGIGHITSEEAGMGDKGPGSKSKGKKQKGDKADKKK